MQVEADTSDKNANYLFVIKTEKTMKQMNLIKLHPATPSAFMVWTFNDSKSGSINRIQKTSNSV